MSDEGETKELVFAETKEYLRFGEFCLQVNRSLRPPVNGVLPGFGSALTDWEVDYFFLTRYLI